MNILAVLAAESHVVNELPFPAWTVGIILIVFFTVCALITFSFRDVANRHAEKAEQYAREHGGEQH
ncbi:MAG: hypothetical protein ACTJFR_05260 [Canibacter sp.]